MVSGSYSELGRKLLVEGVTVGMAVGEEDPERYGEQNMHHMYMYMYMYVNVVWRTCTL